MYGKMIYLLKYSHNKVTLLNTDGATMLMHVAPGHDNDRFNLRPEANDQFCSRAIWPPVIYFTVGWRHRPSCQLITTWWWAGSAEKGGNKTDKADPNILWGSVRNVWHNLLSETHFTPTSGRALTRSRWRLETLSLNEKESYRAGFAREEGSLGITAQAAAPVDG